MRFRRSQRWPVLRRRRKVQGERSEMPYDITEDRTILVPADSCAGRVFGDENLLKPARSDACEGFRACAKPGKKARHVLRSGQSASVKIVPPSELHDPPLSGKPMKLELPERQFLDVLQDRELFLEAQEFGLISEALRKRRV